jgi:hypothetical protein
MGLDMYLTGETFVSNLLSKRGAKKGELYELGYWRKHPNLHGFIVRTFGEGEDNCQQIYLCAEAIEEIITAIEHDQLPRTTGFFFGESDGSEKPEDLQIFREALAWLHVEGSEECRSVFYQASW